MIVPMKKIHVVVLKKDIVPALETLRDLGTVHVEHQEELSGYQLQERREEVEILHEAIHIIRSEKPQDPVEQKGVEYSIKAVAKVLRKYQNIK